MPDSSALARKPGAHAHVREFLHDTRKVGGLLISIKPLSVPNACHPDSASSPFDTVSNLVGGLEFHIRSSQRFGFRLA